MKIISKIKKALWRIGIFLITLRTKVYALTPLYGIEQPEPVLVQSASEKIAEAIISVCKFLGIIFIPLILILGIIVYAKKGKDSKIAKIFKLILIIFGITLVLLLAGLGIYKYVL